MGVALSDTREISAPKTRASHEFHWPRLFAGDCTLSGNALSIFSDGTAEWRASVMSQDAGEDAWGCRFEFFTQHGVPLWRFGWIWSPTLNPTPVQWVSLNQLFFPPYMFPDIARVNMTYRC
jgi:hypothetical protein